MTAVDQTNITNGTLTIDLTANTVSYGPNAEFEFLAAGEFNTTQSFNYTLTDDDGANDTATVFINVTGVNDAPIANDDSGTGFITDEKTAFTTANVVTTSGTDTDKDTTDVLNVISLNVTGTIGNVIQNVNNTFSYDPAGQFNFLALGNACMDMPVNGGSPPIISYTTQAIL